MKKILTTLLICTFLSCKAQSVIKPLDGTESCPAPYVTSLLTTGNCN